jgi:hypothetical protein
MQTSLTEGKGVAQMQSRLMALVRKHRFAIPLVMILLAGTIGVALWGAARAASVSITVVSDAGIPYTGTAEGTGTAVYTYGNAGCAGLDVNNFCTSGGAWPAIPGAHWIWATQQTSDAQVDLPITFTKAFSLPAGASGITGSIQITADNFFVLNVNGTQVGSGSDWSHIYPFDISHYLHAGPTQNVIQVVGTNACCGSGFGNPAGIIFQANVTYVPDSTPPTTTASITGTPGNNNWYRGPVTLTLSATDPDDDPSALKSSYSTDGGTTWQPYSSPVTFSEDGKYSVMYRSTDPAGNQETPKPPITFNIDQTPPTLNITGAPSGTTFDFCLGTLPTRPTFAPTDSLSGLDGSPGDSWTAPTTATGAGAFIYTAHAQDMAGNPASETRTYLVQYGAAFGGVLPPADPSSTRTFNLGSTIPVKFQLMCNGTPIPNAGATLFVQSAGSAVSPGAAISTSAATTANAFSYDPIGQQYIFTLSTKQGYVGADGNTYPYAIGTWTLTIQLDDGTTRTCTIQLVA